MNPVIHFEMPYEDRKRMAEFYANVFGWKTEMLGPEMGDYVSIQTIDTGKDGVPTIPGAINGGFYKKSPETGAIHPSVVIAVKDVEEVITQIKAAGGTIVAEPMEIPGIGRYAGFKDSEGNVVSILKPKSMN
jgi:predicted enzyme related to lactoylglutathione lyase